VVALVPDLLSGLLVVYDRVAWIAILVKYVCAVSEFLLKRDRDTDVGLEVIESVLGWGADYSCTESSKRILFFLRHFFGQCNNHAVSTSSGSHCKTNACVSRCWFDQNIVLLDTTLLFSVQNHAAADTVLHSATWVQEFTLREDLTFDAIFRSDVVDADHRGVADAFNNAVLDFCGVIAFFKSVGASLSVSWVVKFPAANVF